MALAGRIAVVTGASRGIGKGIALQLGEAGATVYVTGRKPESSDNTSKGLSGLQETAKEITERGGKGIAVYVDHGDMEAVRELFEQIDRENNGQLDILVNNAYQAVTAIMESSGIPFYEQDPYFWDTVNNVGLRNHYFCSVYGAKLMVKQRSGLIVNISSAGGLKYFFNVAYGVGKQALDRLAADTAVELKKDNITVVSIWPGPVKTELVKSYQEGNARNDITSEMFSRGESTEYAGKAVVALAKDSKRLNKTGKILITEDLGSEYGFKDIDGSTPGNLRSVSWIIEFFGWKKTASLIPSWVKLPGWVMWAGTSRL
ncbi:unnamed protein product [Caenorhabditis auriculariae]|uniref:Dehydrogenase/reductase SDR family member 1 n=1 Tax=Caenorhabditis auriculariae TaxID=2777116 RepID=A0A8S1HJ68_9PELO|nr:unnamed protein product [Caenorhabditis auriculariae]